MLGRLFFCNKKQEAHTRICRRSWRLGRLVSANYILKEIGHIEKHDAFAAPHFQFKSFESRVAARFEMKHREIWCERGSFSFSSNQVSSSVGM